jgi:hypothetical protein
VHSLKPPISYHFYTFRSSPSLPLSFSRLCFARSPTSLLTLLLVISSFLPFSLTVFFPQPCLCPCPIISCLSPSAINHLRCSYILFLSISLLLYC